MTRTHSAARTAHLSGYALSDAWCLRLDLVDGTAIGMTGLDVDLGVDLGDGKLTYQAGLGASISDVAASFGLDADSFEVTVPIGPKMTLAAVEGGRLNRARARLFLVDFTRPADGVSAMLAGDVSDVRAEGGECVVEIASTVDRLNQQVGSTITNQCRHDFGDARCGVTPEGITGTVTATADEMNLVVSFTGSYADGYFALGKVKPLTGLNAGTRAVEVFAWHATGQVELFSPLPSVPAVGDTFRIEVGCGKARRSTDAAVRTCKFYNNVINFGGEPECPGSDKILKATIPGNGSA